MAIKVNGTTVINDSRQLTNIASVDAATVTALGNAGVGGGPEWNVLSTYSDSNTRQEYTSPAIGVTIPSYTDLTGIGMEFTFDAYRASPDGYTGYIALYLPQVGSTPSTSNAFYVGAYLTFNSSQVNTWLSNQKFFVGWDMPSRYDLSQNSSGANLPYFSYPNDRYFTKSSSTVFGNNGYNGYLTILSSDLAPSSTFNCYYKAYDGYSNFRIRNATFKFLARYA